MSGIGFTPKEHLCYESGHRAGMAQGFKAGLAEAAAFARELAEGMTEYHARLGATIVAEELEKLCAR